MSDRWRQIEELYHRASELPPAERSRFLDGVCENDAGLRREVESLLAGQSSPGFMQTPAFGWMAAGLGGDGAVQEGREFGHYTILSLLGKGGMGEVYRARDRKLGREVAVKLLPATFALDSERLSRFEREARLLASLNHPNIAVIHGLEEFDGTRFLVLELIEGRTLAELLEASRPLPVTSALGIGLQIAGALEAAHSRGVIHRDLKPSNIQVTADGNVKVLDFGLAKAVSGENTGRDLSLLPTLSETMTQEGQVLGTPAYMSPEQVRGLPVDAQADIWAFGCVLFEMLAGRAAFRGDDVSTTLARVLERGPDFTLFGEEIHPWLRVILERCLQKDPRSRFRDIRDIRLQLEQIASDPEGMSIRPAAAPGAGVPRRTFLGLGAAVVVASAGGVAVWSLRSPDDQVPVRTFVTLQPGVSVTRRQFASSLALSPDGLDLIIAGTSDSGQRLYRRSLGSLEVEPITGTEGGSSPFVSPDGRWIGFFADGRLKRVPATGGPGMDIAVVQGSNLAANPAWGPSGRVVFAPGARAPLFIADVGNGQLRQLTTLDTGEFAHGGAEFLPDGRTVLFVSDGEVRAFDLESGDQIPGAITQGFGPRYLEATGHLVVSRGTNLMAAPFDTSRLELTGTAETVVEDVFDDLGWQHYAVSPTGTLAYVQAPTAYELVLVSADGTQRLVTPEARFYQNPQFSPDGRLLAVAASRQRGNVAADVWIYEVGGTGGWQLTSGNGRAPVWTPDGSAVTFSHLGAEQGIYQQSADGLGDPERLVAIDQFHWLIGWTPDGTLAYGMMEAPANDRPSASSLMAFREGRSWRVLGPGPLWGGRLSLDGRLLAYYSQESGRFEVYVTPFPEGRPRWTIAEGMDPSWAPDGSEIYYISGNRLMAVPIGAAGPGGPVSVRGTPRTVVQPFLPPLYDDYHVHPDGRLVLVRPFGNAQGREVVMVQNWFTELRRRAPGA